MSATKRLMGAGIPEIILLTALKFSASFVIPLLISWISDNRSLFALEVTESLALTPDVVPLVVMLFIRKVSSLLAALVLAFSS